MKFVATDCSRNVTLQVCSVSAGAGHKKALPLRCTLFTGQLSAESVGIYHVKWNLYFLH